jgi:hypothetical protein
MPCVGCCPSVNLVHASAAEVLTPLLNDPNNRDDAKVATTVVVDDDNGSLTLSGPSPPCY